MGPVQRQEYLYFNGQKGKHNVLYSTGFSIQEMPVASALLFPADKAVVIHEGTFLTRIVCCAEADELCTPLQVIFRALVGLTVEEDIGSNESRSLVTVILFPFVLSFKLTTTSAGGFTWYEVPQENLSPKHYHTKRLWHMELPVASEGWLELCVRAWDNACNTQPSAVRDAWNWTLHVTFLRQRFRVQ